MASNGTVLNHCSSWDAQSTYHQQLYFQKLGTSNSSSGELNVKGQVQSVIRAAEKICVWTVIAMMLLNAITLLFANSLA